MKQGTFEITQNRHLTDAILEMRLKGDTSAVTVPGQFVELALPGFFLRRPISVCDRNEAELVLVYKTVGKGTEALSKMRTGDLDLLTGLGNGYDVSASGKEPLLIGGGVGIPPLYLLAKELLQEGKRVQVILGFNKEEEIFYEKEFKDLGCEVHLTTVDGSKGVKGFVTDAMTDLEYTYFYSCGPLPMLRAVFKQSKTSGQFSLEERMGCGFGACMGCSIQTAEGTKRVCREGPVFRKEELPW
ncbi:MAG: dihydroorotate dehydrogenase electron transfer subunit [Oscillospiraceae bacterium]|nr:dihydroorotate dehydrogenase electron transfer subunit [Oscillospiraceae bacterium]